jgi:hypothetical protein
MMYSSANSLPAYVRVVLTDASAAAAAAAAAAACRAPDNLSC